MNEDEFKRMNERLERKNDVLNRFVELLMGYVNDEDKGEIIEDLLSEVLGYRRENRISMIDELKKGLK